MIVEILKFCYHGNVMSHFSFLLRKALNTSTVFSDLSLHTLDSLHTENTVFCSGCTAHGFPMMHSLRQCKLQTADWLQTTVFRVCSLCFALNALLSIYMYLYQSGRNEAVIVKKYKTQYCNIIFYLSFNHSFFKYFILGRRCNNVMTFARSLVGIPVLNL